MRRRALLATLGTAATAATAGCGAVNRIFPEEYDSYKLNERLDEPLVKGGLTTDQGREVDHANYLALLEQPAHRDLLHRERLLRVDRSGAGEAGLASFLDRTDLDEQTLVVAGTCCYGAAPGVELGGVTRRLGIGTRVGIHEGSMRGGGSGDANTAVPTWLLRIHRNGVHRVVGQFPDGASLATTDGEVARQLHD